MSWCTQNFNVIVFFHLLICFSNKSFLFPSFFNSEATCFLMPALKEIFQELKDVVLHGDRVSFALLPIRLHLDQHHLDFCMKFFSSQFSANQGTLFEENSNLYRGSSYDSSPSMDSNLTDSPTEPLLPFFQVFRCVMSCRV